jgi:hypothetical protein
MMIVGTTEADCALARALRDGEGSNVHRRASFRLGGRRSPCTQTTVAGSGDIATSEGPRAFGHPAGGGRCYPCRGMKVPYHDEREIDGNRDRRAIGERTLCGS